MSFPSSNNNLISKLFKNKKLIGSSIVFIAFYWVYNKYIKKNNQPSVDKDNNNTTTTTTDNKKAKFNNYFKLPNNLKIHVLNSTEQCDLILNEFYESLLSKIDNLSEPSSPTLSPVTLLDGADEITSTETTTTTSSISALLFPSCNEKNNNGMDFIIGFDAEWSNFNGIDEDRELKNQDGTPLYQHKVALIQLSSKDTIFLIQVSQMEKMPQSLEKILTDPRLIKVGVAVSQDAATIFQSFSTVTKGCVDLVPIARLTGYEGNGLASLALNVLNANLDKNNFVRCSHWEKKQLTSEQIHYAAADAWVGREIFETMYNRYKSNKIDPNEKDLVFTLCRPFINTNFKVKVKSTSGSKSSSSSSGKPLKENVYKKIVPDQRVLYDNCLMYSPDDVLLCSVSKKKVDWYVSRQLADIICQDPLTIKLKFEPNGEGHSGDNYYLAHKENICVVCGSTQQILRHSVVPHCYRQYLPEEIKSHSSHDVLLLCAECHGNMDKRTQIMRMMIAKQYNVSLDYENNKVYLTDSELLKYSKMALILKNHYYIDQPDTSSSNSTTTNTNTTTTKKKQSKTIIPEYKLKEMQVELLKYLGIDEMDLVELDKLIAMNPKQKNENYVPHEKQVMDKVLASGDNGIFEFIRSWRKNFIETVQPKFLNKHWSIDKEIINNYKSKDRKKQVQL